MVIVPHKMQDVRVHVTGTSQVDLEIDVPLGELVKPSSHEKLTEIESGSVTNFD